MSGARATVLVTRPEPGAAQTAALVAEHGLRPVIAPALCITRRKLPLPGKAALQATLITSPQAIPALPLSLRRLPLFAVGDATAARARAGGFGTVESAAADASALAALAASRCDPTAGALLLAVGAGQGTALASRLREHGFRLYRRVAYVARPAKGLPEAAKAALTSGEVACALFFSPHTARAFTRLVQRAGVAALLAEVEALAMSEAVAASLGGLPWRGVRVAVQPNQTALLALLP